MDSLTTPDMTSSKMPKKILIVTGSDYSRQVYQAFSDIKALGHKLYLLSDGSFQAKPGIFKRHFTYDLRKTKQVLSYIRTQKIKFDAVTIKTSEWLTPLVALLAKNYGCIGNEPLVAFNCRSKYHMRTELQKAKIPIPRFVLCKNLQEIIQGIAQIGLPCVAKPVGGNASYGTFLIRNKNDLKNLPNKYKKSIAYLKKKALTEDIFAFTNEEMQLLGVKEKVNMVTDYLIEEFMAGPEISVDALTQNGKTTIMGIAEQVRMQPPFFVQRAEFMPWLFNPKQNRTIETLIKKTIQAMQIKNSASHTEIILTKTGPKIVEIACRMGGDNIHDFVFQTTGYNLMFENMHIALGEKRALKPKIKAHCAMEYILPEKTGRISQIDIPREIYSDPDITEIEISAKIGNRVAPPPKSFDFLGYISVKGKTRPAAKNKLEKTLAKIDFKIE